MAVQFGDSEHGLLELFRQGETFRLDGRKYTVRMSGKPTCYRGEPKTDTYVLAADASGELIEIKISYKQGNADFLENKTSRDRAEALFGDDWQNIIIDSTTSVAQAFLDRPLIWKTRGGRGTQQGSITLGWKFEIEINPGRRLGGIIPLTPEQVFDVYAGTSLPPEKRDAMVNGRVVPGSGIANALLFSEYYPRSIQEAADWLIPVNEHVNTCPALYFACLALNYRSFDDKHDGNRPLSVFVDWGIRNGRLNAELVFDHPLVVRGDEVRTRLRAVMDQLGIRTTNDITPRNCNDYESIVT